MKARLILGSALISLLLTSAVKAATITNLESRPHIVKIQSAELVEHVTILPKEKRNIDQFCPAKCIVTLENKETYEVRPDDNLILNDGGVTIEPVK